MTLQLRPTFSESWYRVVDLKPRLRPTAQITRHYFRGDRWYIVRDPAGNQFHRLSDPAYRFVGLLDGRRTVGEAWELVGGQLDDDAPTQPEVIQILSQLYAANLIETDVTPDAQVLLRRHKKRMSRKVQGRLMNLLFPRVPLLDPDRMLKMWMPVMRPLLSWFGALLWVAVITAALAVVGSNTTMLVNDGKSALAAVFSQWDKAVLLYAMFVIVKIIHEAGHAFTVRRFGGECHEVGIMLLVLVPCPYVDASAAWGFRSKWARVLTGAGGMIFELFIAALATFVWAATDPASIPHLLAYNVMLIASVSTVLFNANPLLRYDGYYILSDILEIPNLQQKSTEYTLGLIKRHIFRVKSQTPLPPVNQRWQLVLYAIASTIYRMFIGVAILLMVLYHLPEQLRVLGLFMAAGAIATFFCMPAFKLIKYLGTSPELHRKRLRATLMTVLFFGAVLAGIGMVPYSNAVTAEAVLEPVERQVVRVKSPGFVQEVHVKDGQTVQAGDVLLTLKNDELQSELRIKQAQVDELEAQLDRDRAIEMNSVAVTEYRLKSAREDLEMMQERADELVLKAEIAGSVVSPDLKYMPGTYLQTGQEIGTVDQTQQLYAYAAVGQRDFQLLTEEHTFNKDNTDVRVAGNFRNKLEPTHVELSSASQRDVRAVALTTAGGGELPAGQQDPNNTRRASAAVSTFEVKVTLNNPDSRYYSGQRATLRLEVSDEPLLWQWTRRLQQLIMESQTSQAMGQ